MPEFIFESDEIADLVAKYRYLYLGTGVSFRFDGGWPSANWDVCLAGPWKWYRYSYLDPPFGQSPRGVDTV
jgi:hypothetical protein